MLNLNFLRTTATNAFRINSKNNARPRTLAQAQAGKLVTISGFEKLSLTQQQHLQAYGLLPGRTVRVLAQSPVTIVLIEQTELAFESTIAKQVTVE